MNNKPILLRTIIALAVTAVFAISIHPLTQRDFYATFKSILKDSKNPDMDKLVADARKKQEVNPSLFPSQALLLAADEKGIDMKNYVNGKDLNDNSDVLSVVRKKASSSIRLGLDLNGGAEFLLELVPDKKDDVNAQAVVESNVKDAKGKNADSQNSRTYDNFRDLAIETLRKRMESQKIFETEISPAGGRYISLRVPVVSKDEKLKLLNLIKMSARLSFCLVHEDNQALVRKYLDDPQNFIAPIGYMKMETVDFVKGQKPVTQIYFVERHGVMGGKDVVDAFPTADQYGQRKIILRFNSKGATDFGDVTTEYLNRQLAIVLDGKLYCAPVIRSAITDGSAEISGKFSTEEAKGISDALASGSLPQINVEAIFDTDPTLGADNVRNGIWAGVLAMMVLAASMITYYRRAGVVAIIGLVVNIIMVLGSMAAFDATLTLPGIAGIILTMGMSVDANVLIYERVREELNNGKTVLNAIDLGYSKAFLTIIDSHLTTLFTGVILMFVGTGAIKGFAVTLNIGIITSLFSSLFITRLVFDIMQRKSHFKTLKMMHIFTQPHYDFLRASRVLLTISTIMIVVSIATFAIKGKNCLGVDFVGGTQITFSYADSIPPQQVTEALAAAGYEAKVTYKTNAALGGDNKKMEIVIRKNVKVDASSQNSSSPKEYIAKLLNDKFPNAKLSGGLESSLGGLVGWEFSKSAILSVILAFAGIIVYVALRFEFDYGVSAVIALIHDVIISLGIYMLLGREISLSVVAAILTIIGYSIMDTIVVFDRIRENLKLVKDKPYKEIVNMSINQTLSRTVLTAFTVFIVVFILFLFGGTAINDFVFVMMLGVVIGTYSSVVVASPIIAVWHKKVRGIADRPIAK
ncbi:MAG: protein translocase subunit SecD [Victivallaceae bacterium]